jgi:hypothetical protein
MDLEGEGKKEDGDGKERVIYIYQFASPTKTTSSYAE